MPSSVTSHKRSRERGDRRVRSGAARLGAFAGVTCALVLLSVSVQAQTSPATPAAPAAVTAPPPDTTPPDAAQITIPPELSEAARRTYNASLKEATDLVTQKNYAAAIAKLDALIAQRPREPQARFVKGVAETEQGKTEAAIATFRALTQDYPELPEPHNNLAVLHAQKGDYDLAQAELKTAILTAPDWPVAHENLGDVYARLAAGEYARAQSLDKANKSAPAKLALARQIIAPVAAPAVAATGAPVNAPVTAPVTPTPPAKPNP